MTQKIFFASQLFHSFTQGFYCREGCLHWILFSIKINSKVMTGSLLLMKATAKEIKETRKVMTTGIEVMAIELRVVKAGRKVMMAALLSFNKKTLLTQNPFLLIIDGPV